MRYHYEKQESNYCIYGERYRCNHPVYNTCTLFKIGCKGIAVIQQRYDSSTKHTWWGEIDPCMTSDIYLHKNFKDFFDKKADFPINGLYPTVSIRQIMWALKMKPLERERWETYFDRNAI